jgi:ribulose 1,5-bisphosphate synthetase/thiazole synthase
LALASRRIINTKYIACSGFLESLQELRRRVTMVGNVALRSECRVTEIVPEETGAVVRGVRFDTASGDPKVLEADLVVDASGRGAPTLTLLDRLGLQRPEQTEMLERLLDMRTAAFDTAHRKTDGSDRRP